jgi:hypothetical protein
LRQLADYADHLNATIMKTFDINVEQAARSKSAKTFFVHH